MKEYDARQAGHAPGRPEPAGLAPVVTRSLPESWGALSVLYVEDEAPARKRVASLLERDVGTLFQAGNGEEGLELFLAHRPDIVVTDVSMPVMDGITMARRIKEIVEDAFVIVTTAHADADLLIEAIEAGVSRYILKPIDYARLQQAIGHCFETITLRRERQREEELRLQLSERLSTLGRLASGIAHEINNPLATISGCAEVLQQRVRQDRYDRDLFESYLAMIMEEVWRCSEITKGMLSIVRQSSYEKKWVVLDEAVDKALQIIGFQGKMLNVEVVRDFGTGLPAIYANEGELRQVLLVIITNALEAMAFQGTLTVATRAEAPGVAIAISDTGGGIPDAIREKIFDSFFTTKSGQGGTGLGLAIAHKIVANHRGSIDVISEAGVGATFVVRLPIANPVESEGAPVL